MSSNTSAGSWSTWVPSLTKRASPFEIKIDGHFQSKVYTSGSTVSGTVEINSQNDLAFHTLEILFTGTTSTHVYMLRNDVPPSSHTFLQLDMLIPQAALPDTHMIEARRSYNAPFTFTIPYRLPSGSCKDSSSECYDRHLQLPPTIGYWEREDLATHAVQINYAVGARLILEAEKGTKAKSIESHRSIKVLPSLPEQPPLHISPGHELYRLSQEKTIRKNLVSPKTGYLRATATQPNPITLSLDGLEASESSITVDLQFAPTSAEATPPEIQIDSAHIEATTHYSLGHIGYIPSEHAQPSIMPNPVIPYSISNKLVLSRTHELVWDQESGRISLDGPRRSSGVADYSQNFAENRRLVGSSESSSRDGIIGAISTKYNAKLVAHFALPVTRKLLFLPTFYSCLVARTYSIRLALSAGSFATALSLIIPLQIAANGCNMSLATLLPDYAQVDTEEYLDMDTPPAYEQ